MFCTFFFLIVFSCFSLLSFSIIFRIFCTYFYSLLPFLFFPFLFNIFLGYSARISLFFTAFPSCFYVLIYFPYFYVLIYFPYYKFSCSLYNYTHDRSIFRFASSFSPITCSRVKVRAMSAEATSTHDICF